MITIISVGKKSSTEISRLCAEYEKRLSRAMPIQWRFIEPAIGKMSVEQQKDIEARAIINNLADEDYIVLLDESGESLTNKQLANNLQKWREQNSSIVFVIGGAHGVSDAFKQRANYVMSLSSLVFPHMVVRLLLIEQLYRSYSIIINSPYHHS